MMTRHTLVGFWLNLCLLVGLHGFGQVQGDSLLKESLCYVNKPGNNSMDMQQAMSYAGQALQLALHSHDGEAEAKAYTVFSQIYREKGDAATGMTYINKALAYFDKKTDPSPASDAYFEMSKYFDSQSDSSIKRKIEYYAKGLTFFERTNPKALSLADALKFMGDLYQSNSEYRRSLPYLKRALTLYKSEGYKKLQDIYSLLGSVLMQLDSTQEAVRYNLLAVKVLEDDKDSTMTACQSYYNMALVFGRLHEYDNTLTYLWKANAVAQKNKDIKSLYSIGLQMVALYHLIHQPEKAIPVLAVIRRLPGVDDNDLSLLIAEITAYNDLKEYDKGRPFFESMLRQVKGQDLSNNYVQIAYVQLLEYMQGTGQYGKMQPILAMLLNYPATAHRLPLKRSLEELAYKSDSAQGDYGGAMAHLKKEAECRIAILKGNYDDQVAKLQTQFETDKKDQSLEFQLRNIDMLKKENWMQKEALSNQRIIRNLAVAGSALLVLLLALAYSRYRIKNRATRELEAQREEISEQNDSLRQLVVEREWLLKEIHHRVKNNLQLVISLLNSQLLNIKDAVAKEVIRESQLRMYSISLIHQKLYQHENVSGVNMHSYIQDLVGYLQNSFDTFSEIDFFVDADALILDVSQAVPLGLILNEAITNAIKYAFVGKSGKGSIRVLLKESEPGKLRLEVVDNGRGLPVGFDPASCPSLGMRLITGLTRQLKGESSFFNESGLRLMVTATLHDELAASKLEKAGAY